MIPSTQLQRTESPARHAGMVDGLGDRVTARKQPMYRLRSRRVRCATVRPLRRGGFDSGLADFVVAYRAALAFGSVSPVVPQHFAWPRGLSYGAAREHLLEHRYYVNHERAVISIEIGDMQVVPFNAKQAWERRGESSWPSVVVVHEGPCGWPGRIVARAASVQCDVVGRPEVKKPSDLDVRELLDPLQRLQRKLRMQPDDRFRPALEVVEPPRVPSHHGCDDRHFDGLCGHDFPLLRCEQGGTHGLFVVVLATTAPSGYSFEHRLSPLVDLSSCCDPSVPERGEHPAHVHDSLTRPARLNPFHGVQGLGPCMAGGFNVALVRLHRAHVAQGDGVRPAEGFGLPGQHAVSELAKGSFEVTKSPQGACRLVGQGGLLEEPDPMRITVAGPSGGEVVLSSEERCYRLAPLAVHGKAAGADNAEQRALTWCRQGVPLAVDGSGRELHSRPGVPQIDCLMGHGPEDMAGQRCFVGFRGELQCQGEVASRCLVFGSVEAHPASHVHGFGSCGKQVSACFIVGEDTAYVFGDVIENVLAQGCATVHPAVALVPSGEELSHLADSGNLADADVAEGCGRAGPGAFRCVVPPLLSGQDKAAYRVGSAGQQLAAFQVHVASPEIHQRGQRIDAPLGCRVGISGRYRKPDFRQSDRALQPSRQRLTQDTGCPAAWTGARDPHRDVRTTRAQQFMRTDLGGDPDHCRGDLGLRPARLCNHSGQSFVPVCHPTSPFTRERSLTGLTASRTGRGYQPVVIHGSLKVNETTICLCPGGHPVKTSHASGANARTLPGSASAGIDAFGAAEGRGASPSGACVLRRQS
ncbi:hypothetical protein SVIRM249S_01941 [Streptomyces viridochromogenes]